jgi:hypothetical protein
MRDAAPYPSDRGYTLRHLKADKARKHLRKLTAAGVGCREVARRTGVRRTTVGAIYRGAKLRIRGNTERKILSVTCLDAAGGALVNAALSWKLINDLLAGGFTRTRIAFELGSKAKQPALQIGRTRCRARSARQVRALWRKYMTAAGE